VIEDLLPEDQVSPFVVTGLSMAAGGFRGWRVALPFVAILKAWRDPACKAATSDHADTAHVFEYVGLTRGALVYEGDNCCGVLVVIISPSIHRSSDCHQRREGAPHVRSERVYRLATGIKWAIHEGSEEFIRVRSDSLQLAHSIVQFQGDRVSDVMLEVLVSRPGRNMDPFWTGRADPLEEFVPRNGPYLREPHQKRRVDVKGGSWRFDQVARTLDELDGALGFRRQVH
jgi:hypothetical protein